MTKAFPLSAVFWCGEWLEGGEIGARDSGNAVTVVQQALQGPDYVVTVRMKRRGQI